MNNENVQPKKKKPVFLIILLIILGIGCIGTGYYLNESGIFNKLESEPIEEETKEEINTDNQNEKDVNIKDEEKTSETVPATKTKNEYEILIGKYMMGNPPSNCGSIEIFAKDKIVTANDIDNLYAANTVTFNAPYNESDRPDTITLEEFTKEVKKYYGESYEFNAETLVDVKALAGYIYTDGVFKKRSNNWGGTCGPSSTYKYSDVKKEDDKLEVYVYVVFSGKTSDGLDDGTYYADYNRTNKIEKFDLSNDEDYKKGTLYKFTFKLENNNYIFVSSEPAK